MTTFNTLPVNRARYDSEGNIILEPVSKLKTVHASSEQIEPNIILVETREATWTVIPDVSKIEASPFISQKENIRTEIKTMMSIPLAEGSRQLCSTVASAKTGLRDAKQEFRSLPKRLRGSARSMWALACTPVALPGTGRSKKNPTKMRLFVTDTVRFGGTFTLIFGVLFAAVNYQSFFQIAKAQLALGNDVHTEEALQSMNGTTDTGTAVRNAISAKSEQNILKHLPAVGPYEDRLIIPKLGKNIPIVRPSIDALVSEDWKKFEEDIQESLRDGVVHYPGSARPGQAGNFFVTGHSSYYPWDDGRYKDVFARLHELDIGDTYFAYYGGDKHTYRVISKYEVKPNDVTVLDQPSDKRLSTLMTCTPIGTTLRRLIVLSEEIDPKTGIAMQVGEKNDETVGKPFARLEALPI